jgi:excisionase family DNA binding protein
MLKQTWSVKQLAGILDVSKHTVYEWVRCNKVPYLRLGRGRIRFDPSEVSRVLRTRQDISCRSST